MEKVEDLKFQVKGACTSGDLVLFEPNKHLRFVFRRTGARQTNISNPDLDSKLPSSEGVFNMLGHPFYNRALLYILKNHPNPDELSATEVGILSSIVWLTTQIYDRVLDVVDREKDFVGGDVSQLAPFLEKLTSEERQQTDGDMAQLTPLLEGFGHENLDLESFMTGIRKAVLGIAEVEIEDHEEEECAYPKDAARVKETAHEVVVKAFIDAVMGKIENYEKKMEEGKNPSLGYYANTIVASAQEAILEGMSPSEVFSMLQQCFTKDGVEWGTKEYFKKYVDELHKILDDEDIEFLEGYLFSKVPCLRNMVLNALCGVEGFRKPAPLVLTPKFNCEVTPAEKAMIVKILSHLTEVVLGKFDLCVFGQNPRVTTTFPACLTQDVGEYFAPMVAALKEQFPWLEGVELAGTR